VEADEESRIRKKREGRAGCGVDGEWTERVEEAWSMISKELLDEWDRVAIEENDSLVEALILEIRDARKKAENVRTKVRDLMHSANQLVRHSAEPEHDCVDDKKDAHMYHRAIHGVIEATEELKEEFACPPV
jgi:uncharacterized coiled-coil DUF342 family protein